MTTNLSAEEGKSTHEPTRVGDGRARARAFVRVQIQQSLAFVTLVVLLIFFSIMSPAFFTWSFISGILLSTAVIGILALGTTFVIVTGGIDLSVGTGMTLCAVMTAVSLTVWHVPFFIGVLVGVITGALMGAINGANVALLKLPPFIATLAMMLIAQGLALVISGVRPVYTSSIAGFKNIALGELIGSLPNAVLILFVGAIIAYIVLSKTILGRYTYAIGSNEGATRLSGVNTSKWMILIYTFAGVFTGVAGVVIASRLDSAQPQLGLGYELQAIAAVIIGGTSLLGGRGTIMGTLIGALVMSVLINGLRIISVDTEWQNVVVGLVILIAVVTDSWRQRRAGS